MTRRTPTRRPPASAAAIPQKPVRSLPREVSAMFLRRTRRPVTLQCETLEDRCVPATFSFNPTTATLTVTGTAGKDAVVINDDGTNNAGAVSVQVNGTTLFTSGPTAGVNQVHAIQVNTLGGN